MAGQNDFLIFDENNENILTQANYASDTDRANGFRTGLARSIVTNKVLHQTSMVCHALGELAKDNDQVATDTGNVAELKTALKNALGGADINLSNLSSTGQAKFDAKVSKTGDTMTGGLRIDTAISNDGIILKNTSDNTSSSPSTDQLRSFRAVNNDDTILGDIRFIHKPSGDTSAWVLSRNYATGGLKQAILSVDVSASGVPSCTFPNTTCCDGQWAVSGTNVANNVSLPIGTDQRLEYDISSMLPNDGYNYMVLISVDIETGSGSGASVISSVIGKDYNGYDVWARASNLTARGSWIMTGATNAIIPVNSSRKIWLNYTVYSKIAKLNSLYLEAFRRIGTNG